jgi:hypothetical protein
VIPDLSRQIEVTRFQNLFDEIFEMPGVKFALAGTSLALHEHIESEFAQTVLQCTVVACQQLVFAQF